MIFHCDASSALLQLDKQWLDFTYYSLLTLSATGIIIQIKCFTRIKLTSSVLLVGERDYILDHSGDEWCIPGTKYKQISHTKNIYTWYIHTYAHPGVCLANVVFTPSIN